MIATELFLLPGEKGVFIKKSSAYRLETALANILQGFIPKR